MARDFSGKIEYFQHRRTFSHDSVEFQILQQLLLEGPHATPLVVQRGDIVQCFLQARAVDRLRQEVHGSPADGIQRRIQGVIPLHQNNVYSGIGAQRSVQELVPVHLRHAHVHQRQPAAPALHQL